MKHTSFLAVVLMSVSLTGCIDILFGAADWGKRAGSREAWKTLALQGDAEAQYEVGKKLCCGSRPKFDNVQALFWYCKAARQNQRDALLSVGQLYERAHEYEGTVIPRNNTLALTYYTLAVKHGNNEAVDPYKALEPKLNDKERKDSAKLVHAWPNIPCEVFR